MIYNIFGKFEIATQLLRFFYGGGNLCETYKDDDITKIYQKKVAW
jgi:hypothetical protein